MTVTPDQPRRPAAGRPVPARLPPDARTVHPDSQFGETSGRLEDADDPSQRPDEHSGVRILRPPDQADEPRRVRQVPPPGEPADGAFVEEDEEDAARVPTRDRVLGVNIAGSVAHLAVVEPPDRAALELVDHLVPANVDDDSRRLANFADRVGLLLRELGIAVVAVARPLRYTNWTYANAFERVSLETCFMLEAQRLSLRFESVGQHHAANVIGLPAGQLTDSLPARLRIGKSPDWPNRYPAVLVALAVALEM